ncbi:MAG: Ig-like domain-containing protein, partial [Solimonas sp.]
TSSLLTGVLRIEPANPLVQVGATVQLTAIGRYDDGSEAPIPQASVAWSSANTAVATITNGAGGGVATGRTPGQSTITATVSQSGVSPNSATTVLTVTDNVCTGPLLASAGATAVDATNMACIACSVANKDNAIDSDPATVATLQLQLGLLAGEVSLTALQQENLPLILGGRPAGFLISRPAALPLSAEVLNQLRIATVRRDGANLVEVESFTEAQTLRLTLLGQIGGVDTALVSVNTTAGQDYEGVRVALTSGVATLLSSVNVNSSCATAMLPVTAP